MNWSRPAPTRRNASPRPQHAAQMEAFIPLDLRSNTLLDRAVIAASTRANSCRASILASSPPCRARESIPSPTTPVEHNARQRLRIGTLCLAPKALLQENRRSVDRSGSATRKTGRSGRSRHSRTTPTSRLRLLDAFDVRARHSSQSRRLELRSLLARPTFPSSSSRAPHRQPARVIEEAPGVLARWERDDLRRPCAACQQR